AFEKLYWWLRGIPSEQALLATVDDLAARYGVDTTAYCAELCMDWREIGELAGDPLATIEPHTVNHVILAKATDVQVRAELNMGRAVIEAALGQAPAHLAYPF